MMTLRPTLIAASALTALLSGCSSPAGQQAPNPSGILADISNSDPALAIAGRAYASAQDAGSGQYQAVLEALAQDPAFLAQAKDLGVAVAFTPGDEAALVITADDGSNECTIIATVNAAALTCNPPGLQ